MKYIVSHTSSSRRSSPSSHSGLVTVFISFLIMRTAHPRVTATNIFPLASSSPPVHSLLPAAEASLSCSSLVWHPSSSSALTGQTFQNLFPPFPASPPHLCHKSSLLLMNGHLPNSPDSPVHVVVSSSEIRSNTSSLRIGILGTVIFPSSLMVHTVHTRDLR